MSAEDFDSYEDEEEYDGPSLSILDRETGRPRVLSQKCETCIFHAGNRMSLQPGRVRDMVRQAVKQGGWITCHATLPGAMNPAQVQAAVCRGFFDGFAEQSNALRVFSRLGEFTEVQPPPKREARS